MAATYSTAASSVQPDDVALRRLAWVGPLTIIAAVIGTVIVRTIAAALLNVGNFPPLGWGPPIAFTVIGALGAVLVFALIGRFARRPITLFKRIALGVLVVSFVPDILLLVSRVMPGTTVATVGALAVMHVLAWTIIVRMLTTLAVTE
ncbi:MAG: hypothetical protein H0X37_09470 [Herpetosiphonaceae bacterium]|nr:hypothetical protein [Herpetosiphonaceae bacterium]